MTIRRQSLLLALAILPSLLLAGCPSSSSDNNNNNPPPASPTLSAIAIAPSPVNVTVGGATQQLTVTGTYSDASTAVLTSGLAFVSSAPAVATVGASTGIVTAVTGGTATVTATHTASGKTATVTVNVAKVLNSIAITPSPVNLAVAGTQQLTVTGTYNDASTANLTAGSTFVSSATSFATVSSPGGLVTAVAAGTATVTATHTASGKTATVTVNVTAGGPTLDTIAITPNPVNLAVAGTQQLTVTGTYSDASTQDLTGASTFASGTPAVASVGAATGLVTAVATGSATVTATHTASGKTATVTVNVATTTGGLVFVDGYDPGVSFKDFGGATNAVDVDATTVNALPNGHKSVKFVVPASNYTGGAFVAAVPRNLSAFNALTFWAKASTAQSLNVTGIGNDAAGGEGYSAESLAIPVTGTWTKFIIPIPAPSKYTAVTGLFHLAEGPDNYTLWVGDIQYESLAAGVVDPPTAATVTWPGAQTVGVGSTYLIPYQPNTVSFTHPTLPNAGKLTNVGFRYYDLLSSAPAVATVSPIGLVSGVSGGSANITAAFPGLPAIPGQLAVTVTAPLATPTNNAPNPTVLAANVISLFSTAYTNQGVDTWQTSWSTCCNDLVDPYAIPGGHPVKQYTLRHFVGVEFGLATPANTVDATTMTHFHVDVWSPNPSGRLQIQLVNNPGASQVVGIFNATFTTTGAWIPLEIPLSSFAPALTTRDQLRQLLFLAQDAGGGNSASVVYVDNIYFHK